MKTITALAFAFATLVAPAYGVELQSVSRIAFGPANVLFVADWKRSAIDAVTLLAEPMKQARPFNIHRLSSLLAATLGRSDLHVEDIAPRPGTDEVYVALSMGRERTPAIVSVTPEGVVTKLDVSSLPASQAKLEKPPAGEWKFLGEMPERSFTVTDMKFYDDKLYVAGLSNLNFASALRVIPYPFDGKQTLTSVAIYHTSHNEIETRAPIRAMVIAPVRGVPTLIAGYTCTPLVTIPLNELKDGARVRGKTIAELGYGNTPDDMILYSASTLGGPIRSYVLVANAMRSTDLIALASIEAAAAKPGYSLPVPFGTQAGVQAIELPLAGVLRIADEGGNYLVALRRNLEDGEAELVTYDKRADFRLSDFPASEYTFPDYSYSAHGAFQTKYIKPEQGMLKGEEGYPDPIRR